MLILQSRRARLTSIAALATLLAALSGTGCTGTGRTHPPTRAQDATYQRETLYYLASDHLEGRGPGTQGLDRAGDYIAEQFRKAGLKPAGSDGYFQSFVYNMGLKSDPASTLSLGNVALSFDTEFRAHTLTSRKVPFSGDLVFAGYGIASKQYGYDDYSGLDVKGKTVLIQRYEPRNEAGKSRFTGTEEWSVEAGVARKFLAAQQRGATGVILVNPPGNPVADSLPAFTGRTRGSVIAIPVAIVSRNALDKALASAGQPSLESLGAPIDGPQGTVAPASKSLGDLPVTGSLKFKVNDTTVRNVLAILPGSGPLSNEFVVVGSHYDHLGMGGSGSLAGSVNAIHPGADDNASGTTAMLTVARRLAASTEKPNRSILFMAYTVEEQGLLGSQYFVRSPTVPMKQIAYMLNLDMVGRMKNSTLLHAGEGTASTLPEILDEAYKGTGVLPRSFGKGGFGPSDHESFARAKVPVIALFTGLHPQYHRPADKADTINYPGLLSATDIAERVARGMAGAVRAEYDVSSEKFRQDVGRENSVPGTTRPAASSPSSAATERVGLGLMPDMASRDKGMRVEGVTNNSAAARAGLKADDVIIELAGKSVDSVEDLQAIYDQHKPGDKVSLKFTRAGETKETQVTFSRRGGDN